VSLSTARIAVKGATTLFELAAGIIVVLCVTGPEAKAYADPGSGAVLWQLFFASIVSIGFHFRKLRLWFTSRRSGRGPVAPGEIRPPGD
jgi:hypothetical protein